MSSFVGEQKYPAIFKSGKIGAIEVANRTIMCPMGCSASPGGYVNTAVINHYVERAKGGIGLIIVEVTCVDAPQGLNSLNMLRIDHDHFIPGMTRLAESIHQHGSKCLLQISHTGRGAKRKVTNLQPVGPSAVAMPMMYAIGVENEEPRALTIPEIERIEDQYAQAALRAKKAGFDGVELHSTGYYLGVQFLSRSANIRTDAYGGERENRILFHKNIFAKIKKLCGEQFTIAIKATLVQGEEITFEDGAYYATRFAQIGFDGVEVLAGSTKPYPGKDDLPGTTGPENQMFELVSTFKGIVDQAVPEHKMQFFAGGRAHEPNAMNAALEAGKCDYVFLGKAVFAEPHLVNLIREDRYDEARPCIGCGLCMSIQLGMGDPAVCSGNAVQGRGDQSFVLEPLKQPTKVVVVGAGIAGVEAAVVAKKRGAQVILFEETDAPGGQAKFAAAPPNKDFIGRYIPYFKRILEVSGVDVRYNTHATAQMVLDEKPDAVICATGLLPAKPAIAGFEQPHVVHAREILEGSKVAGEQVVVIGGVSGCEVAELLLSQGKEVTIVETLSVLAGRMQFGSRCVLLAHLEAYGLKTKMNSTVIAISDKDVLIMGPEGEQRLACDTVVMSVGDPPNKLLATALEGKVPKLFCIGDANMPGGFFESVSAGHTTAAQML